MRTAAAAGVRSWTGVECTICDWKRWTQEGRVKLKDIANRLACELEGDGNVEITGVVGIDEAEPGHLTFVSNPKYAAKARSTRASAVIVAPDFPAIPVTTVRHANPYLIFAKAIE